MAIPSFHAPGSILICSRCKRPSMCLGPLPPLLRCPCGAVLRDVRPPDPLGGETLVLPPERPGC